MGKHLRKSAWQERVFDTPPGSLLCETCLGRGFIDLWWGGHVDRGRCPRCDGRGVTYPVSGGGVE